MCCGFSTVQSSLLVCFCTHEGQGEQVHVRASFLHVSRHIYTVYVCLCKHTFMHVCACKYIIIQMCSCLCTIQPRMTEGFE